MRHSQRPETNFTLRIAVRSGIGCHPEQMRGISGFLAALEMTEQNIHKFAM
jgi:hypothetical protein